MANAVELRPSGAPVWVNCPGAPSLWASIPDDDSDVAREGTAAHWLVEKILGSAFTGEELIDRQAPNGVFISEDMLSDVQIYLHTVRRVINLARIEHTHTSNIPAIAGGTTDADGRTRHDPWVHAIVDLKYGWRIVEPFENWQLITYAHQVYHEMQPGGSITGFDFYIVQPRASHPEGPVRRWQVSVDELQRVYWPKLTQAAQGGDCITGPQCRDCKAVMACKALRLAVASATQYITSPVLEEYSGDELATELKMLEAADIALTARKEAIREMALLRVMDKSSAIPGWTIERSGGSLHWLERADLTTLENLTGVRLHKQKPLTPLQAISAGLPEPIVHQNSLRAMGKPKLVKFNPATVMRKMTAATIKE